MKAISPPPGLVAIRNVPEASSDYTERKHNRNCTADLSPEPCDQKQEFPRDPNTLPLADASRSSTDIYCADKVSEFSILHHVVSKQTERIKAMEDKIEGLSKHINE
eukprot:4400716-Karenia_brevis.AAC.1